MLLGGGLAFAVAQGGAGPRRAGADRGEELVGASGDVRVPLDPVGQVFVEGALWRAKLGDDAPDADADRVRERGARVRVEAVEGLTLRVRPLAEVEATEQGAAT